MVDVDHYLPCSYFHILRLRSCDNSPIPVCPCIRFMMLTDQCASFCVLGVCVCCAFQAKCGVNLHAIWDDERSSIKDWRHHGLRWFHPLSAETPRGGCVCLCVHACHDLNIKLMQRFSMLSIFSGFIINISYRYTISISVMIWNFSALNWNHYYSFDNISSFYHKTQLDGEILGDSLVPYMNYEYIFAFERICARRQVQEWGKEKKNLRVQSSLLSVKCSI